MNYKPFYYYLLLIIFIINAGIPYTLSFLSELEIIRDINIYSPSLINYIIGLLIPFFYYNFKLIYLTSISSPSLFKIDLNLNSLLFFLYFLFPLFFLHYIFS